MQRLSKMVPSKAKAPSMLACCLDPSNVDMGMHGYLTCGFIYSRLLSLPSSVAPLGLDAV